jgi:hypothetical protein
MLVATLESKLMVNAGDTTMTIGVDWHEPTMAAKLVVATEQQFLETRHYAEVGTLAEYIQILEGHAQDLRQEIDEIADQIHKLASDRGRPANVAPTPAPAASDSKVVPPPLRRPPVRSRLVLDEELPRLKMQLEEKKKTFAQLDDDHKRRLRELQLKLTEAKLRYTPAHPIVVDLEKQVAAMSEETPEMQALRGSIEQLEAEIKERTNASIAGSSPRPEFIPGGAAAPGGQAPAGQPEPPQAGPLPADITQLQNSADSIDPAIAAQFRYAVAKYTTLRDQISTARIDLDAAQAAFKYRYQVLTPADVPNRAIKPKVPLIVAAGLIGGLLLALLLPIGLELKRGKIVERWQVAQIPLPILAELRFPPHSPE